MAGFFQIGPKAVILAITVCGILVFGLVFGFGQKRRDTNTQTRPRTVARSEAGGVTKLPANANLQAALSAAKCDVTIVLEAGTSYVAPPQQSFILPNKSQCPAAGPDFITITTSDLAHLPPGTRVKPENAPSMARIVTSSSMPAVYVNQLAHHYRFVGIEFTNIATTGQHAPNLILGGDYTPAGQAPHHIEFDRCFFHPIEETTTPESPLRSVSHALALSGYYLKLTNSHISGFMGRYITDPNQNIDSMGIIISSAPFTIENNYIAAWYNNILIGGSDPAAPASNQATVVGAATLTSATLSQSQNLAVGDFISFKQPVGENANGQVLTKNGNSITFTRLQVNNNGGNSLKDGVPPAAGAAAQWNGELPSDIQIRQNTFDKPMGWKALMGTNQPKAWIEIKLADGLIIDGNVFQGYPSTVGATIKNQAGSAPWSTVRDVAVTNNRFTSFSYPFIFNLLDELRVSTEGKNIIIANNLCTGAGGSRYYGISSKFLQLASGDNVQVYHNTCFQESDIVGGIPTTRNFVFRDNITNYGTYGMNCMAPGGFNRCWPGLKMMNNLVVDTRMDKTSRLTDYYPANNYFLSSLNDIGLSDPWGGNYSLSSGSRYKNKASDGTDPGVDVDALNKALKIAQ
jgi:hypothetical protein